jgi:bifunctional DNase/RNase
VPKCSDGSALPSSALWQGNGHLFLSIDVPISGVIPYEETGNIRLGKVAMGNETAVEMFVGGLVLDPSTQAPIVVLKDATGDVTLPIWIGIAEATSIASAIKQVAMPRPLTHDLFHDLLLELGVTVQRVVITELKDSTYYSELVLGQGDRVFLLDSRPSDAIAMALRAHAPIYVTHQVLDQAKIAFAGNPPPPISGAQPQEAAQSGATEEEAGEEQTQPEDSSKDFKGIDKDKWQEILDQLDAEDFKYKM